MPELWNYEMLNLILSACRCGRIDADQVGTAMRLFQRIPAEYFDHQSILIQDRMLRLASRFSLSAYDAAYLELADRLQSPLRSLDDRLAAAARALGLV